MKRIENTGGKDIYLYRAVDKDGQTVNFLISEKRDKKTALRFFCKAIEQHGLPEVVTLDKSAANKAPIDQINEMLALMMGFKSLAGARSTIAGIELHRMLRKGQHQQASHQAIFRQFYILTA